MRPIPPVRNPLQRDLLPFKRDLVTDHAALLQRGADMRARLTNPWEMESVAADVAQAAVSR